MEPDLAGPAAGRTELFPLPNAANDILQELRWDIEAEEFRATRENTRWWWVGTTLEMGQEEEGTGGARPREYQAP